MRLKIEISWFGEFMRLKIGNFSVWRISVIKIGSVLVWSICEFENKEFLDVRNVGLKIENSSV